jgi:hypothetical protein
VVYGVEHHLQQYFSNIMAVSLFVEENREPLTLLNITSMTKAHITCMTKAHMRPLNITCMTKAHMGPLKITRTTKGTPLTTIFQ